MNTASGRVLELSVNGEVIAEVKTGKTGTEPVDVTSGDNGFEDSRQVSGEINLKVEPDEIRRLQTLMLKISCGVDHIGQVPNYARAER